MKVSEIITELNKLGGENGIGIIDIVENRVVGMKSRGVYETPGGTILMAAHEQLEELILDRDTMEAKKKLGSQFAQVVYEGKWFTPLREAIQAFVESTQKYVTGEVKFKLYKGNIIKAGTTSPYSLYNESLASFTTGDMYDHHDADGFITLFGLPLKVRAMKHRHDVISMKDFTSDSAPTSQAVIHFPCSAQSQMPFRYQNSAGDLWMTLSNRFLSKKPFIWPRWAAVHFSEKSAHSWKATSLMH